MQNERLKQGVQAPDPDPWNKQMYTNIPEIPHRLHQQAAVTEKAIRDRAKHAR